MKLKPTDATIEAATDAAIRDDNTGICISCGAEHDGVEPDAERYKCFECGLRTVYGAQQILNVRLIWG